MAARPDLVDEDAGGALEDNPASLTDAFQRGAASFAEAGRPEAYFGFPRKAAAEGIASFQVMATALVSAIVEALSSPAEL
jgi:creatinine amidohydrolase